MSAGRVSARIVNALLARRGGPVTARELADAAYGDRPDGGPSDRSVIHVHVRRLRRVHRVPIVTTGRGYALPINRT